MYFPSVYNHCMGLLGAPGKRFHLLMISVMKLRMLFAALCIWWSYALIILILIDF